MNVSEKLKTFIDIVFNGVLVYTGVAWATANHKEIAILAGVIVLLVIDYFYRMWRKEIPIPPIIQEFLNYTKGLDYMDFDEYTEDDEICVLKIIFICVVGALCTDEVLVNFFKIIIKWFSGS